MIAEAFPEQACPGAAAWTNQDFRSALIWLAEGETVTNVHLIQTVNAATITTAKASLHQASDLVLKGVSANITGAPLTTGANTKLTIPLVTPYLVPVGGGGAYYVGFFINATTPGSYMRGASQAGVGQAIGSGRPRHTATGALSDIPDPMVATYSSIMMWLGVS
jgi:hypothetical protein